MNKHTGFTVCGTHVEGPMHICAFVDSRDQQYDILLPWLQEGLACGDCLLAITDPSTTVDHAERLRKHGIDAAALDAQGHKLSLTSNDCYVQNGRFSAEDMYTILAQQVDKAEQQGFTKVRGFGEMQWARDGLPGTEELIEYESRLNYLNTRLLAICVYDVNDLDGRTIMDILNTHPKVIMGGRIHENPYYIHPDEFLKSRLGRMTQAESAPSP